MNTRETAAVAAIIDALKMGHSILFANACGRAAALRVSPIEFHKPRDLMDLFGFDEDSMDNEDTDQREAENDVPMVDKLTAAELWQSGLSARWNTDMEPEPNDCWNNADMDARMAEDLREYQASKGNLEPFVITDEQELAEMEDFTLHYVELIPTPPELRAAAHAAFLAESEMLVFNANIRAAFAPPSGLAEVWRHSAYPSMREEAALSVGLDLASELEAEKLR